MLPASHESMRSPAGWSKPQRAAPPAPRSPGSSSSFCLRRSKHLRAKRATSLRAWTRSDGCYPSSNGCAERRRSRSRSIRLHRCAACRRPTSRAASGRCSGCHSPNIYASTGFTSPRAGLWRPTRLYRISLMVSDSRAHRILLHDSTNASV